MRRSHFPAASLCFISLLFVEDRDDPTHSPASDLADDSSAALAETLLHVAPHRPNPPYEGFSKPRQCLGAIGNMASRGQRQTGTPATYGRARHESDALVSSSWSARWLGATCLFQRFSGASTDLLPPPRQQPLQRPLRLSPILGLGRAVALQLAHPWAEFSHGESPNGPSSGVIITSLGGDTLCPSRHTARATLCVGCGQSDDS